MCLLICSLHNDERIMLSSISALFTSILMVQCYFVVVVIAVLPLLFELWEESDPPGTHPHGYTHFVLNLVGTVCTASVT